MPVAIALIAGVVVLATTLIGLVWAVVILLPFYVYVAAAVYLIRRSNQKHADLSASVKRDSDRQKLFNEQEMRAWHSCFEQESRTASRRERLLRRFDSTRDPGKK